MKVIPIALNSRKQNFSDFTEPFSLLLHLSVNMARYLDETYKNSQIKAIKLVPS